MSGTRREWIRGAAATGLAGTLGLPALAAHAEPPPETTVIRLANIPGNRYAPQYVAEDLLRVEGFSDVRYVRVAAAQDQRPVIPADPSLRPLARFGEEGVEYVLVGGQAVRLNGFVHAAEDVDLLIRAGRDNGERIHGLPAEVDLLERWIVTA